MRIFHKSFDKCNHEIAKDGVTTFPWLSTKEISRLKEIVKNINIGVDFTDVHIPTPFRLSAFNNNSVYKSNLYDSIYGLLAVRLNELLPDYTPLAINVFEKHPDSGFDSVPVHQNPSFVIEPDFSSVSIWIPLQDVCKENGTVGVMRGSHNKFNRMRAGNMPNEFVFEIVSKQLEEKYFEPLDLRTGEVAALDDSIIHWSYPNISDDLRIAVQLIMVPKEAQHIYYFYNESGENPTMDLYKVDKSFFFNFNCKAVPTGLKKITSVPYEYKKITEKQLLDCIYKGKQSNAMKYTTDEVAEYYDNYTESYLQATGDFIQAYRSSDTNSLMQYCINSMGLKDGMHVLDAGCGVCAPAIWIAHHFPKTQITSVTNSKQQYSIAVKKIKAAGMEKRICLICGDYHHLQKYCSENTFDAVMFLESLGHNHDLDSVFRGVNFVLKKGGLLYIKDFFKRYSTDYVQQQNIDEVVEIVKRNYLYNVMNLPDFIKSLVTNNFSLRSIQHPNILSDIGITIKFEDMTGRFTYPSFSKIVALDWYEILAICD